MHLRFLKRKRKNTAGVELHRQKDTSEKRGGGGWGEYTRAIRRTDWRQNIRAFRSDMDVAGSEQKRSLERNR